MQTPGVLRASLFLLSAATLAGCDDGPMERFAPFRPPVDFSTTGTPGTDAGSGCGEGVFKQGALVATSVETNLAIVGLGYFPVRDRAQQVYTRDGNFFVDSDQHLRNSAGLVLQAAPVATADGTLIDLTFPWKLAARATTVAHLHVNLDARNPVKANAWDPTTSTTAAATSNYNTSETVYDSLGGAHRVDVYFQNPGANGTWNWHVLVDGAETTGGVGGTPVEIATGTLAFDNRGALNAVTTAASSANFVDATPDQVIAFDFGSQVSLGGTGLDGSTSLAQTDTISLATQDGFVHGVIYGIAIASDGQASALYSNNQSVPVGQILLARFDQPTQLTALGGHRFVASSCSGAAHLGVPGSFELGLLTVGSVEQ